MYTHTLTIDEEFTSLHDPWETLILKNIVDVTNHVVILGPR
jgi:hypothetical protein